MTDAEISEAKRSTTPEPADSETRKKVFIACIHRPGFDRCVPHSLISEKIQEGRDDWRGLNYNLQRNWPLLKIIGCFESERDARGAVDVSFCAMKTEGVVCPRECLYKMRQENYPLIACEFDDDASEDLNNDDDSSGDERMSYETACELVEKKFDESGPPTLWSIFPFDMHLTRWALPEVFVASQQYNASCGWGGPDEDIHIFGAFQGAAEARTAVLESNLLQYCDNVKEDAPPLSPKKFPSTLLIPDMDIAENWHADGTGCISFQVRDRDIAQLLSICGIDRASLRVQKVSNVPASKPIKLLAAAKSFLDTLVWLQLCNPQGIVLFSFVRLPTPVRRPFAGTRVYGMLTHAERLRVVGCGLKGELVRLLSLLSRTLLSPSTHAHKSLGMGRHCEPQRNPGASHKMMLGMARRVAAGLAAPVNSKPQSKKRARRE